MVEIVFIAIWGIAWLFFTRGFVKKYMDIRRKSKEWVSVDATVIHIEAFFDRELNGRGVRIYSPKCRYIFNSKVYEHYSENTTRNPNIKVSYPTKILINPNSPNKFLVDVKGELKKG